jgi:hypothetical protein
MDGIAHENRILKVAVVLLVCVAAAGAGITGSQRSANATEQHGAVQRLPGAGSGVVDVSVVNNAVDVRQQGDWRVAQQGDWRVVQQGDWRVGVQGTVTTTAPALPFLNVGATYTFQWAEHWNEVNVVREIHPSGWVRVDSSDPSRTRWINPSQAASIDRH